MSDVDTFFEDILDEITGIYEDSSNKEEILDILLHCKKQIREMFIDELIDESVKNLKERRIAHENISR